MIRRVLPMLLVGALLLGALAAGGQEPSPDKGDVPLRLKKKKRPGQPDKAAPDKKETDKKPPDKDKEKDKEDDRIQPEDDLPGPGQPQEDEKDVLERVRRNMRSAEERLGNREVNDGLAQTQKDVLRDLDALIRKSEQQQQQQNQGGGGGEDNQPQGGEEEKGAAGKQGGRQQKGSMAQGGRQGSRQGRRQRAGRQRQGGSSAGRGMAQQPRDQGGNQPQQGTGQGGDQPGAGGKSPLNDKDLTAEMYKDVWGHLPESLRAQMNAYANPRPFSPRYDELIKKYYRTIAEQGRKKGD